MGSLSNHIVANRAKQWIATALCVAVVVARMLEQFIHNKQDNTQSFVPILLPLAASVFAAAGIIRLDGSLRWLRVQRVLLWSCLLLMVWIANGLLFDLFAMAGLIGDPATGLRIGVDLPGMVTRTLALAAVVVLARLALARPTFNTSTSPTAWYGYVAFALALPYPVLRIWWALGGTVGLINPGAASHGFVPLLLAIPFLLAAVLSLLLASPRRRMSRRLLLTAGWSATAIVASIAPAACWSLVTKLASGDQADQAGIALWVVCLFYGSWLLWAIAGGAATRSYQLRSAGSTEVLDGVTDVSEAHSLKKLN